MGSPIEYDEIGPAPEYDTSNIDRLAFRSTVDLRGNVDGGRLKKKFARHAPV
jgi:hypothetical protein